MARAASLVLQAVQVRQAWSSPGHRGGLRGTPEPHRSCPGTGPLVLLRCRGCRAAGGPRGGVALEGTRRRRHE
eukprot:12712284-Alexandrium_andersonii.AAC.1